jgi:ABC-2 type transport system permease protein
MNQLSMLIRREFWEHRATFFVLPAVITGVFTAILAVFLLGFYSDAVLIDADMELSTEEEQHEFILRDSSLGDLFGAQLQKLANEPRQMLEQRMDQIYTGVSVIWFLSLWIVVFFYLLGALYDDRKDRSVLFWKSMPVSDWLTVTSKLAAGLVLAPAIYFGFTVFGHLLLALAATVAGLSQGIDVWAIIWSPANLVSRWIAFLGLYSLTLLWCLPFFAWLLLVSSWAKSAPLAWAVGVPIVLVITEGMIINTSYIGTFISEHTFSFQFWQRGRGLMESFQLVDALEFLSAMVIGMVFIFGATWCRGKADEM